MLTLALDLYTHSIVAFRLTPVADTAADIAMLLRDVMMPLREGWGEEMEWPYPGVPATVVAQFAGHRLAALPFFSPEIVTTDHGAAYKNHQVVEAERALGCDILPARTLRPTDKFVVERVFGALNSLLLEHLLGFTGADVADRGADPEADAVLSQERMEHLIVSWVVGVWQKRTLDEYAPAWGPGEDHSLNSLFAAAIPQGGFALQVPKPDLYYRLLTSRSGCGTRQLPTKLTACSGRRFLWVGRLATRLSRRFLGTCLAGSRAAESRPPEAAPGRPAHGPWGVTARWTPAATPAGH